jgi:hypothetical protein
MLGLGQTLAQTQRIGASSRFVTWAKITCGDFCWIAAGAKENSAVLPTRVSINVSAAPLRRVFVRYPVRPIRRPDAAGAEVGPGRLEIGRCF